MFLILTYPGALLYKIIQKGPGYYSSFAIRKIAAITMPMPSN